ncbi:hypothetical protein IEE_05222 [Bacillus cereus BAG5X1-1]|uniref:Cation/H+ exchanger transmembrane domain-containing protein n=1 Tax=Bacillus cereus BAG5X1-1 TaxID=1053189 RepID=J7ZM50_BACCE|nr:cation:proton antiporter [Bacillus cereus]EJQ37436.1 hypothetical protein IEE_05222 [Bacillus cereus BAG5X1-1]
MNTSLLFLKLLPALIVIITLCYLMGQLVRYLHQPKVVGEMIAGVILGPSLLGVISPEFMNNIFSPDVKNILYQFSNLGLGFYMFLIGLEIDRDKLNRETLSRCTVLSIAGIFPSFLLGIAGGIMYYQTFSVKTVNIFTFALYMAVALSLTAFPVLARILQERKLTNSTIGRLTLISAAIEDVIAWGLVAVVIALAQSKSLLSSVTIFIGCTVYILFMVLLVKRWMTKIEKETINNDALSDKNLALILIIVLISMWVTDYLGVHHVCGGFVAGLIMPQGKAFKQKIIDKLGSFVTLIFLPIFFAYSGLNTDLNLVLNPSIVLSMFTILMMAIVGKMGGCSLAMRTLGASWRDSVSVGILMNARGSMLLVLANVGLSYGIIVPNLFTILVLIAIITTMLTMPLLNFIDSTSHIKIMRKGDSNIQ